MGGSTGGTGGDTGGKTVAPILLILLIIIAPESCDFINHYIQTLAKKLFSLRIYSAHPQMALLDCILFVILHIKRSYLTKLHSA